MLLPDVNVLVNAFRTDAPEHETCARWLSQAATGGEMVGLCDGVLMGFVRVVTHPRIFTEPSPTELALEFCDALLGHPNFQRVSPGTRAWRHFVDLLRHTGGRGNHVPDAWLAAMALELEATWVSSDADFARYPGLDWRRP